MDGQRWLFFLSVAVPEEQPRRENITCQAGHRPITCLAGTSFRTNHALFSGGRKSETAAANASTLEIMFSAMGRGVAGYAKPNTAQTAKITNMPARRNNVYLDSFMTGENVSIAKLRISTRMSEKKKSTFNITGTGAEIRHITMRSKGSSKIIGAAMVPTMALPTATQNPLPLAR